jgi:ABC-type nickel/cobalt efflux system permease component RcnA
MRVVLALVTALIAASLAIGSIDLSRVAIWAVDAQRDFQNQMAGAIRALKSGDIHAYFALLGATTAYGFVHALGPGHGKYLVCGVGLGTSVSVRKLVGLATASSLTQSLWAIVLVFGGFLFVEVSAQQMTLLAEDYLAPLSYVAIASVGLLLVWRGLHALTRIERSMGSRQPSRSPTSSSGYSFAKQHALAHASGFDEARTNLGGAPETSVLASCAEDCDCVAHGPTPEQAASVRSLRDAVVLVLSIAIRPCTGAIFLLVIAWQMDLALAGALAVLAMGFGTAALTSLVAISSVAARSAAVFSTQTGRGWRFFMPAIQVFSGATIALISLGLLGFKLTL